MTVLSNKGTAVPGICVRTMGIGRNANQESRPVWRRANMYGGKHIDRRDLEETEARDLREAHITMQMRNKCKCLITEFKKETPLAVVLQLQGHVTYDTLFRLRESWHRGCFHQMLMSNNCYLSNATLHNDTVDYLFITSIYDISGQNIMGKTMGRQEHRNLSSELSL